MGMEMVRTVTQCEHNIGVSKCKTDLNYNRPSIFQFNTDMFKEDRHLVH